MRADLRAHIEMVGRERAMLTDPPFKYGMEIISEVLDIVEVALRAEGIDAAVTRRILDTIVFGSSTRESVMAEQVQRIHLLDAADLDLATLRPRNWTDQTPD